MILERFVYAFLKLISSTEFNVIGDDTVLQSGSTFFVNLVTEPKESKTSFIFDRPSQPTEPSTGLNSQPPEPATAFQRQFRQSTTNFVQTTLQFQPGVPRIVPKPRRGRKRAPRPWALRNFTFQKSRFSRFFGLRASISNLIPVILDTRGAMWCSIDSSRAVEQEYHA